MAVPVVGTSRAPGPESDPNRRALASIDAVHDADPGVLNEHVARLRRFVRVRRPLYYSILAPAAFLSRVSPLLVSASGVVAALGVIIGWIAGAPAILVILVAYWAGAALWYHALSVRLAALMEEAATSVGWDSADVLARWQS